MPEASPPGLPTAGPTHTLVGPARRMLAAVAVLAVASVVVFVIARSIPTTPMAAYLQSRGIPVTEENLADLRRTWGLDAPPVEQYLSWMAGLLRGDWGTTTTTGIPIGPELAARMPLSLAIGGGALLGGWLLAYLIGTAAATGVRFLPSVSRALAVLSQSVPVFVVAVAVINVLGVELRWVPFYALQGPAVVVAPTVILALFTAGQLTRTVTEHARALSDEPFVRAELGRGFDRSTIVWVHGRRQVLYGMFSASIGKIATVTGAAAVLEFVFAVPGINLFMIDSIRGRDYAVIQAYLMATTVWVVLVHVVLGVVLGRLDPRRTR
ncbi:MULTISPECIES: ABC transporter permease subunit [Pseudonocardia]|uniref:Nickel transport system permease protein NikB n=2 Tax=Pseudonocardia TaxID=1847 RepID=A0A1Y2MIE2_PSEAH|nr:MULTISPECIES: ABC transporter permease subunit [Pseudonocardia]OSY34467.1 Nickel transport system permease protein NikB [Pseudonocardia autotrophica]TDN72640.1 peptide/nickel transport system permease protein [Pseudonocardia autotrophica]BBG03352.1 ABC transporter permease [Pseudonocardia autotrophica]GEC29715.1 ABC transporter permease [Pseudonocardia saturnea]